MTQEEKFKRLLDIFDPDTLTKAEFVKSFENVVKQIKKVEAKYEQSIVKLEDKFQVMTDDSKTEYDGKLSDLLSTFKAEMKKLDELKLDLIAKVSDKLTEVKDGKDADEETIVGKVLSQIKLPEQKEIILDDAFEIRNKLETLNGDERLSANAISGLQELLDEIKNQKVVGGKGGGFSKIAMDSHFVDDETPSGTKDGANTDFKIAATPIPAASLKVYINGQRMRITEDYTLSGRTISFLVAPAATDILLVDYRT